MATQRDDLLDCFVATCGFVSASVECQPFFYCVFCQADYLLSEESLIILGRYSATHIYSFILLTYPIVDSVTGSAQDMQALSTFLVPIL